MTTAHRDRLIRIAHTYAFVPEWHTVLVKLGDRKSVRMLDKDAYAIAATADSSHRVRRTVHKDRRETIVTDYCWSDGKRIRMTETCAL